MKFILGTKVQMTQIFDAEGRVYPATVISAGPVVVTQIKTKATDGYDAVQVGYGSQKESRINKAQKKMGTFRHVQEFRVPAESLSNFTVGQSVDVSQFAEGDKVVARSKSKGKGFQGGVRRHHFKGGPRTHGQKHSEREVGSIGGAGRAGGRVAKGMRMPGRMGSDMVTVKNLKVLQVNKESNELVVEGSLPGVRGVLVTITA